ncbi:MAG TPA: sugar ABC transporter substrate-binding protein [Candidatus Dormibacteraeota bacterium]|nr:sugar ABC transporter substrate-binding protein [Candidatus Dormibacteraeota bacterium]
MTRSARPMALAAAGIMFLAACGGSSGTGSGSGGSASSKKIALLLPETKTARYESKDRPLFEAKVKELCGAQILYSNANQDAPTQQTQADAALTNGANVLVLDPVDGAAAAAIATKAKTAKVPVVSYDRLILGAPVDYYISFDNAGVGKLQGQALLTALKGKTDASVVQINGDPTDNNATLFKQGAHSVLDSTVKIKKEYDTPQWSPDNAQKEMSSALTALNNKVDGVLAANDGTAGGAIAAMKAAGVNPLPPITGQDAELAAIQRIVLGTQTMTVYKAIVPEAQKAAELACDLASGTAVPASMTGGKTTDNKSGAIPSILLTPVAVTKANVKDTIIADKFWTVADICTSDFAAACKAAGIQ